MGATTEAFKGDAGSLDDGSYGFSDLGFLGFCIEAICEGIKA